MSVEELPLTLGQSFRVGQETAPADVPPTSAETPMLTARMAKGEESAYRQFFALYFNRLLRYLIVLTGGREEAAREALQLTLLRVVRHARAFDSEAAFWSWLTVLARSSIVDEERKRRRYAAFLDRFFRREQSRQAADTSDADHHLLAFLDTGLGGLSDDERALIERKYFAGDSVREIAGSLNSTEKAIESRLVRLRRKLKDAILNQLRHEHSLRS